MICELLISGVRPSAVPSAIHTVYETLYNESPEELPSVSFVRTCCVLVEVMGETLTAIKLANVPEWSQLWTDSTTRRQIPFTNSHSKKSKCQLLLVAARMGLKLSIWLNSG